MWYSLLLLGYKTVKHVTVLNTVGNCTNGIIMNYYILRYNLIGPPSSMLSVVDRNVVMRSIPVYAVRGCMDVTFPRHTLSYICQFNI